MVSPTFRRARLYPDVKGARPPFTVHDLRFTAFSTCRQLLLQQLPLVEVCVLAARREQLVVRAALDDASLVEDADQICIAHGRDAVRDDEARALAHHAAQLRENFLLGVGVDGRESVVEYENPRLAEDGARNRRALLLPAGERDAALADERVEAFGELAHVVA